MYTPNSSPWRRAKGFLAVLLTAFMAVLTVAAGPADARGKQAEAKNLKLVGKNGLQGRSAYQPVIEFNPIAKRWVAYVGHHDGSAFNPKTDEEEPNGTSLVDVTNPKHPKYLFHIPGEGEGGAQMARVCNGSDLPNADPGKVYLLRTLGNEAHQIWDVTDPKAPSLLKTVVQGLNGTHKSFWECSTGIAYLVSGVPGWRTERMTQVFDLSNPAQPRHIRDFGLPGQEPGSTVEPVPTDVHGMISLPDANRIYFGYGTGENGYMQIVDRNKLLTGPPFPDEANLLFPQVSRLIMSSLNGAHTTFPVLGMTVDEFADWPDGGKRDIVVITAEAGGNECTEGHPQMVWLADITDETTPQIISNYHVDERSGDFCSRGGRFGSHASNENMTPIYYRKVVFISYFNAGVRAVDIRNPYSPKEAGFYIPAINKNTFENCIEVNGEERCKRAIQTNNVEVDDRGFIYIVDRAGTGMHILKPSGKLAAISGPVVR